MASLIQQDQCKYLLGHHLHHQPGHCHPPRKPFLHVLPHPENHKIISKEWNLADDKEENIPSQAEPQHVGQNVKRWSSSRKGQSRL